MSSDKYKGLDSRIKLAERLVQQYTNRTAPSIVCITGNSGVGKSFVVENILNELKVNKKMTIFQNFGESFVKYNSKATKRALNSLSFSAGNPVISLGIGIGWENNSNTYTYIRNMLSKHLVSDVLFCVDNFSNADSKIRSIVTLITENIKKLQEDFKVSIFLLFTDSDINHIMLQNSKIITEYILEKYDISDVKQFLSQKYSIMEPKEEEIKTIAELCNGNLKLVEFLHEEEISYGSNYLEAIEKVVNKRLVQLKQAGKKENLNEKELEEMILSASLSVKQFTSKVLTEVVQQEDTKLLRELEIAKEESLLIQDFNNYYDFSSYDFKSQIAKQTMLKRKDWLLMYYTYYTQNEQDEYFNRAYYLIKYQGQITSASFTLLMLAYSAALEIRDIYKAQKIKEKLCAVEDISSIYRNLFTSIEKFYHALTNNCIYDEVDNTYNDIDMDELDIPLKAELMRAYFHYLYVNTNMNTSKALTILEQCKEYALNEIYVDIRCVHLQTPIDETVLRLRIIYDIAPCILDCLNQYDNFQLLYEKSKELSMQLQSLPKGKNIGSYIENVFNRKAFLFINQTQCGVYYHKAKKYFKENEIWDEYCITLICEAGTDIVIQQYEEALKCCEKVISICAEKNLLLPFDEKMYNNKIIAEFFLEEKKATNQKYRMSAARKAVTELKQLLKSRKCATEYVILTNICSLSLYYNNDKQYQNYKRKIEKLYGCPDISNIDNKDIDDFYRYYFSWFELYRNIRDECWNDAESICNKLDGFIPALFRRQEVFWEQKNSAVKELIKSKKTISSYDFCNNLVKCNQREQSLAHFFHRGLMLSDLQYTSYL